MSSVDDRKGRMYLGRVLAITLAISVTLLISCMICLGPVLLGDPTTGFEQRLPLPGENNLAIVRRPVCTWDRPSIVECYQGGVRAHPEASLEYCTLRMCQTLVSFTLPDR